MTHTRKFPRLNGTRLSLAIFLMGAGSASAETIVNVTQIGYDSNLRAVCSVVRMDPTTFTSLPSNACAPAAAVSANGPDRVTKTTYDAAGQVTAVQQAYATSDVRLYARYTYTADGLKESETDANGNRTSFSYDGYNRLVAIFYPKTLVGSPSSNPSDYDQFTYDLNGNRTSWRRRNGQTINYTYDKLNRQLIADVPAHPDGAYNATEKDIYTTYDLMGRVKKKAFASYTGTGVSYTYNAFGWVATTTDVNNRTISYLYNAAGARVQMTDATGYVVNYDLDNLNRVKKAFLNGLANVLYGYGYNNLGQRTLLSRGASGAGGSTTYAYDNLGRLQGIANDQATTGYDITWGKVGTVGTVAYNPANQITTWASNSTTFDYVETATAADNRTFDGLNRDAAIAAVSGGYDANGNLTKDSPRAFVYDIYNRLLTATGGASNLSLDYDPEGRLVNMTTASGGREFLYDGTDLIAEYAPSSTTPASRYVHGSGTDDPIVWLLGADDSDRRYYYTNYQGSIIGYTGAAGQFVIGSLTKYGAYGEPRNSSNAEVWPGLRFAYTGQMILPNASLYYYKARVYDPKFGRFLQTDPVGSKDDLDLYAYVKGDPINGTDPTGNQVAEAAGAGCAITIEVGCAPGAVVGAIVGGAVVVGGAACAASDGCKKAVGDAAKAVGDFVGGLIHHNDDAGPVGAEETPDSGGDASDGSDQPNPPNIDDFGGDNHPDGWVWKGKPPAGGHREGAWNNPDTGESMHDDRTHPPGKPPHQTYTDPSGQRWDNYGNGWEKQQ